MFYLHCYYNKTRHRYCTIIHNVMTEYIIYIRIYTEFMHIVCSFYMYHCKYFAGDLDSQNYMMNYIHNFLRALVER